MITPIVGKNVSNFEGISVGLQDPYVCLSRDVV